MLAVVNGKLGVTARYLGPHLHVSIWFAHEIGLRIRAAEQNFQDFAKVFRSSTTDMVGKIILFKCLIQGALVSAMVALPVSTLCDGYCIDRV